MSESLKDRETRLMQENMGLVVSISKSFKPSSKEEFEDFKQVAAMGLLRAIRTLKTAHSSLSTWAYKNITWALMRHLENKKNTVQTVAITNSFAEQVATHLDCSSLHQYLPDSLSDQERRVLELRCENRDMREIAIELGMTPYFIAKLFKSAVSKIIEANNT